MRLPTDHIALICCVILARREMVTKDGYHIAFHNLFFLMTIPVLNKKTFFTQRQSRIRHSPEGDKFVRTEAACGGGVAG